MRMRAVNDCEICCGPNETTLESSDVVGTIVRVCRSCLAKIEAGEALVDIYDFCWWKDKCGIHAAYVEDERAPEGCKAREDIIWRKVPVEHTGTSDTSA